MGDVYSIGSCLPEVVGVEVQESLEMVVAGWGQGDGLLDDFCRSVRFPTMLRGRRLDRFWFEGEVASCHCGRSLPACRAAAAWAGVIWPVASATARALSPIVRSSFFCVAEHDEKSRT